MPAPSWLRRAACSGLSGTLPGLHFRFCTVQKRPFADSTSQEAPWIVRASEANHQALAAESISKHGFVILKNLFDAEELKTLTAPATSKAEEIMSTLRSKRVSLGIGSRAGFREVCLRSPGRYDIPCEFKEFPSELLERIESIASKVLADTKSSAEAGRAQDLGIPGRAFAGLVRAQPKSEAQIWHADSPHSVPEHQGPHLLNVLVPSGSVTSEMGPTELVPGSHLLTNHLKDSAQFGTEILYQSESNSPQMIGSSEEPIAATMDAGSILIFDDRVLHRGGQNRAARDRDVTFFSYTKADFMPSTYYESVRTLKTYDHTAMAATIRSVLEAMMEQLRFGTANIGGSYDSSRRAEQAVASARSAMDLSRCALDGSPDAVGAVVDHRTRLVAMGAASNGVGTAHDITSLCQRARDLSNGNAWTFVDAVHYAPHGHLDVQSIGCDFLACSPYKFFGPHAGVLYGRRATLESLPADRLDCSDNSLPSIENGNMSRWELGTQNYEALAGITAAGRSEMPSSHLIRLFYQHCSVHLCCSTHSPAHRHTAGFF
ncbi:Probable cysteine desulfurase [Durusdinium trenchii]|uniref:Probable cysteine desulfurase n=1 Tax=Durusdinium trenchii TaxID=1381693 RepID=A0ABP0S178_9DINO